MSSFKSGILSQIKILQLENVVIKNKEEVEKKLNQLIADGISKLQVIADYDSTLTKSHIDGKPTLHSFDVFNQVKSFSKHCMEGCDALTQKFDPEYNNEPDEEKKQKLLDMWSDEHETLLIGERMTLEDVQRATDEVNTPLRDGCEQFLLLLNKLNVPVIVLSAGIGDVIRYVLRDFRTQIIANFINCKDGKILSFSKPTVSIHNKSKIPFEVDKDRHNVILLGDNLADCRMADNLQHLKTILRIGFLAGSDKEKTLESYSNCFDIVLLEDQTMQLPIALLKLIANQSQSP